MFPAGVSATRVALGSTAIALEEESPVFISALLEESLEQFHVKTAALKSSAVFAKENFIGTSSRRTIKFDGY
jgi:hypothetical protein